MKDSEHNRRAAGSNSVEVQFTPAMKVLLKREDFLKNSKNKTELIKLLSAALILEGFDVTISDADADTDIVKRAVQVVNKYVYMFFK